MSEQTDNPYERAYDLQKSIVAIGERIDDLATAKTLLEYELAECIRAGEAINPESIGQYLLIPTTHRKQTRTLMMDDLLAKHSNVVLASATIPASIATRHMVPAERQAMITDPDFRLTCKVGLGAMEKAIGKLETATFCDVKTTETVTKRVEKRGNVR